MMGDASREDKLAAARKKLKQYQKRKEADKAKISSSRQSTPDSQVDLAPLNGKEVSPVAEYQSANNSAEIISNEITVEKSVITDITKEAKYEIVEANQNIKSHSSGLCFEETNTVHSNSIPSLNDNSRTMDNIINSEASMLYNDSSNNQNNIQNYFNKENNETGCQNIFDDINTDTNIGITNKDNQQRISDTQEEQKSLCDMVEVITVSEQVNIQSENTIQENDLLQVHTQTISILVAEKSELQSQLQRTTYDLEKRNEEMMELNNRLDLSQNEVISLQECNLTLKENLSSISESVDRSNTDYSRLNTQLHQFKSMCEDVKSVNEELNIRLTKECDEKGQILQELLATKGKLELANIHLQQLRDSSNEDLAEEIRLLKESHEESQKQIVSLQSSLDQAAANKASLEQEYKSYGNHLVAQLEVSYQKVTQTEATLQQVMQSKLELEAKLGSLNMDPKINEEQTSNGELEKLNKLCEDLSIENNSLKHNFSALEMDNKALSKMCVEQRESLEKLEVAVDRRDSNEVDTNQLLQSMQSDKVAAARALSQNKQLKEQLEELQNGFIMMSNKKLELTEKLEVEVHFKKRLQKEMSELRDQMNVYSQMVAQKTGKSSPLANTDQAELEQDSKVTEFDNSLVSSTPHGDVTVLQCDTSIQVDTMNVIMEDTRNSAADGLCSGVIEEDIAAELITDSIADSADADNFIGKDTHLALETRFIKCMRDLAASLDEKQCLDNLVQRLQLETEAVGDYITIYQFQRGVMRKEVEGLTSELAELKEEREKIRVKLAFLQNLVKRLTRENGLPDMVESQAVIKSEGDNPHEAELTTENVKPNEHQYKEQTVRKIIKLISEMESTSQTDVSVLNRFHPCPLCSGKLINV